MPASAPPAVIVLDVFSSGLAIARRMSELGAEIHLIADWARPETRTRGARSVVALPFGEAWIDALLTLAAGRPDAIVIPGTDRAVGLLLAHASRLPDTLRRFERPGSSHLDVMAKDSADAIARSAGVGVPYTAVLATAEDLLDVAAAAPWPCVVKPVDAAAYNERVGGPRTALVRDVGEAEHRLREPFAAGLPMLLSQFVPGGDDCVEEAVVVRLADGSYPVQFGVHKLRQAPAGFGETALGESAALPEATAIARRVLDAAGFVGVAGVEVKRDCHTGERWFLEVNARVPNQWGLGDACGVDATRRLVAAIAGEPLGPQPPLREGVRFVAVEKDARLLLERLATEPRRRWPAIATAHLRPWLGAGERTVLSLRDPAPGVEWLRTTLGAIRREGVSAQI